MQTLNEQKIMPRKSRPKAKLVEKKQKLTKAQKRVQLEKLKKGHTIIDNVKDRMPQIFSMKSKNNISWLLKTLKKSDIVFYDYNHDKNIKIIGQKVDVVKQKLIEPGLFPIFAKIDKECRIIDNKQPDEYCGRRVLAASDVLLKKIYGKLKSADSIKDLSLNKSDMSVLYYISHIQKISKCLYVFCKDDVGRMYAFLADSVMLIEKGSLIEHMK